MSAALPPVPDLIPISALRKGSNRSNSISSDYSGNYTPSNNGTYCGDDSIDGVESGDGGGALVNNNNDSDYEEDVQVKECAPCGSTQCNGEVMGEQRSRRTKQPTAAEVIDTARSRGRDGAAPGASRKTERHRKSDRRRDRDRERRKRSNSSKRLHHNNAASDSHHHSSTPSLANNEPTSSSPRVNPIFVWVRQKDTHIVEVKCEDYDKRNRILLTKTAQGWRAIPRTETLAPALQKDDASGRYCKKAKRRSNSRPKRKSFGVQVDEDELLPNPESVWSADESEVTFDQSEQQQDTPHLLPEPDVNNRECSADSVDASRCASAQDDCQNNISPLDNLLAVAELEFNQQIEAERWETKNKSKEEEDFDMFIESCNASTTNGDKINDDEECEIDYNDEDDNNLAMDDILSRLEQSLQSPDNLHSDIDSIIKKDLEIIANGGEKILNHKIEIQDLPEDSKIVQEVEELIQTPESEDFKPVIESLLVLNEKEDAEGKNIKSQIDTIEIEDMDSSIESDVLPEPLLPTPEVAAAEIPEEVSILDECVIPEDIVVQEETESPEDTPTDLSLHITNTCDPDEDLIPTDLSIPKCPSSPQAKRPASQNSETIQSPQPSGIPAVPPSPDLYSANKNNTQSNSKSNIYLESLLSPTKDAIALPEKEPLDLGKARESDSPKVTCSQEEPPSKKIKLEDITLKTLLDSETPKEENPHIVHPAVSHTSSNNKSNDNGMDTPRLLELLTSEEEDIEDPVGQLKQVLSNNTLNIPDPMLIPKDRLSQILSAPAKEIPKLLKQRPELRLPEALAFPHLLQDPDILVITLSQLKLIVEKQSQSLPVVEKEKSIVEKEKEKPPSEKEKQRVVLTPETRKSSMPSKEKPPVANRANTPIKESRDVNKEKEAAKKSKIFELSNEIDAATNAAFSQMMWLPYLNQMEAMNNPEFLKFLSTMMPGYLPSEMSHIMRPFPPPTFPLAQSPLNYNPLELSMWQENMLQQARTKNQLEFLNSQKIMTKNVINPNSNSASINSLHSSYQHQFQQPNVSRTMSQQYAPPPSNHQQSPKYSSKNKSSTSYQQSKQNTYHHQNHASLHRDTTAAAQRKYESEKLLQQQIQQQQQQQLQLQRQKQQQQAQQAELQRQEFLKQQELLKQQQEMYHKPKVACKPFANLVQPHLQSLGLFSGLGAPPSPIQQQLNHQQQMEQYRLFQQQRQQFHQQQQQQHQQPHHHAPQQQHPAHEKRNRVSQGPIDLSGGPPTGKLKVKQPQHLVDPKNAARLLKYDDVAEVGSTTSSIDEMQEAQKHLWHPLFGNQKSYTSPWNWTTVTAAGE